MARVKRSVTSRARHRKVISKAKGYYGRRKNTIKVARQAVERAMQYAYRDRRRKKRDMRALWITRINAASRIKGIKYSELISALQKQSYGINRKILADMAVQEPEAFNKLVDTVCDATAAAK